MRKFGLFLVNLLLLTVTGRYFLMPTLLEDESLAIPSFFHREEKKQPDEPEKDTPEPEPVPEPTAPHPADSIIAGMTLEEKVGQMFFARCPEVGAADQINRLHPAGFILFARNFEGSTPENILRTTTNQQSESKIPLLIGVDEEGGTVVRISKFRAYRRWPFQSPQQLDQEAGVEAFTYDTQEKGQLLKSMGINVNLAPVCDVVTDSSAWMYKRALGKGATETAEFVRTVVGQMQKDGVGAVLKHFPGYGNSGDTHESSATDSRELETYRQEDFLPFKAGIEAGANAILVSHVTVNCMDTGAPASLSPRVHEILRDELDFDGVIMTDDLSMEAIGGIASSGWAAVLAVQAGNDLIITSDLETQHESVVQAVRDGTLTETQIEEHVKRVLDWKVKLGLMQYSGTAQSEHDTEDENASA